jgi:hypothetical protein
VEKVIKPKVLGHVVPALFSLVAFHVDFFFS